MAKAVYSLSERGKTLMPLLYAFDAWDREQIEFDKAKQKR